MEEREEGEKYKRGGGMIARREVGGYMRDGGRKREGEGRDIRRERMRLRDMYDRENKDGKRGRGRGV